MDEGHRHLAVAQHVHRVHRVELVGHDRRRLHQRAQVDLPAGEQAGDDVARLDDADQPVDRAFGDRDAVVRAPRSACWRIVAGSASTSIQSTSVRGVITSRVGRSASRTTRGDDRPLAFLEHAGGRRLGDDQMEILGGDVIARFAVDPQQAEDQALELWSSSQTNGAMISRQPAASAAPRPPRSARASAARSAWAPARRSPARHRW